jgi:NAD(P)-dependent dehydrogenase (short-subunit alcohol dehydrogenase family)
MMDETRKMLVVGSCGGIGQAVCREARSRGWRVVGTGRREGSAAWTLDMTDIDALELTLARLFAEEGPFGAVVYCAGVCPVMPLARLDSTVLTETARVNVDGFLLVMKHFSRPGAYAKDGAAAVAISSVSAQEGWAGGSVYCATKGALSAACRALDRELAGKRIRVSALEPHHVLTDMFRQTAGRMGVPEASARAPEALAREILDSLQA